MKTPVKNNPMTLDTLALMVAEGFNDITSKMATKNDISRLDDSLGKLDNRMAKIEGRMEKLESRMEGLGNSVNNYLALSDKRYLELKARQTVMLKWITQIADKTGVTINLKELEQI